MSIGFNYMGKEEKNEFELLCEEIGGSHADRFGVSTQRCEVGNKVLDVKDDFSEASLVTRDREGTSFRSGLMKAQAEASISNVEGVRKGLGEDNRKHALVVHGGNSDKIKLIGEEE